MRFLHVADLHIGRKMNGYSLIEDQKEVLEEILHYLKEYEVDAIVLAGDIYDRKIPPEEAVELFDSFITDVVKMNVTILMSSGNHDSAQRIGFGNKLFEKMGVYVSYPYDGTCKCATLHDAYGDIHFYLLPFIKPLYVRSIFDDQKIETYTDAMQKAIDELHIDRSQRNVMVSHQFVGKVIRCDEETLELGGLDQVDSKVYDGFDYVALGHIHRAQKVDQDTIRYSGSIYPYSFMKNGGDKSCTLVEIKEKNDVSYKILPFHSTRTLKIIDGMFEDLMNEVLSKEECNHYVSVVLHDEKDIPNAFTRLKSKYPNIMEMRYDNMRTSKQQELKIELSKQKDPYDYCLEFYEVMNNQEMNDSQQEILKQVFETVKEGEE